MLTYAKLSSLLFAGTILFLSGCGSPSGSSGTSGSTTNQVYGGNCDPTGSPFGGGSGSQASPYEICSATQLENMGDPSYNTLNFVLETNLNLSNVVFNPLPDFGGTFNGNSFTISNLTLQDSFIADNTGVVQGLVLINANISGDTRIGALLGTNENNGQLVQSSVSGTLSGEYDSIGGLVGYNWGQISESFSSMAVVGEDAVGGLVGTNHGAISNCYSTGAVNGQTDSGGLVGSNYGTITNSFSSGKVPSSGTNIGGLVGIEQTSGVSSGSYWDTQASGTTVSQAGTGETTAQMQTPATFAGWDFTTIWNAPSSGNYPSLR
jgi:hypothetical protein